MTTVKGEGISAHGIEPNSSGRLSPIPEEAGIVFGWVALLFFQQSMCGSPTTDRTEISHQASGLPLLCSRTERFEEICPDAIYRGFNFLITIGAVDFTIRHYDDLRGVSAVISPRAARELPEARLLVNYLESTLGSRRPVFYDPVTGAYREVDGRTLEFIPTGI
jgi:hypothetical protein